jgi:hypothetical protein
MANTSNTFKPVGPDVCGLLKLDAVMEVGQSEYDDELMHKCLDAPKEKYELRCVIWLYATEKEVHVWPSLCVLML